MTNLKKRLENVRSKQGKKPPLGSGERFKQLESTLASRPGVTKPGALAAWIGRKKLGKGKFQKLAAAGKKKA